MAKIALADLKIESQILPISSLKVHFTKDPKTCKSNAERARNTFIIIPDGRMMKVSPRFWLSFSSLFNLGINLFEYFTHDEVFARLTERKGTSIRITMEGDMTNAEGVIQSGVMLSCTNPSKPILKVEEVRSLVEVNSGDNALYEGGVVQASFDAPYPEQFQIGNSEFSTRFMLLLPIDGYGLPSAYLELKRKNTQAIISGVSKAFRTQFQLGKQDTSLTPVLERAMDTFNNEEGYHTFKQRLESGTKSWASFYEAGQLHDLIESVMTADGFDLDKKTPILKQFNDLVGNPLSYYGVTGANELSTRKAKTIPVQATVFDLFNFVTEVNTHYITTRNGRQRLNEWVGQKLAEEYDLEGTVETNPEFKDFFLAGTKGIVEAITAGGERILHLGDDDSPPAVEVPTDAPVAEPVSAEYPVAGEVCDECKAVIPDTEGDMVNTSHGDDCSLHPNNVVDASAPQGVPTPPEEVEAPILAEAPTETPEATKGTGDATEAFWTEVAASLVADHNMTSEDAYLMVTYERTSIATAEEGAEEMLLASGATAYAANLASKEEVETIYEDRIIQQLLDQERAKEEPDQEKVVFLEEALAAVDVETFDERELLTTFLAQAKEAEDQDKVTFCEEALQALDNLQSEISQLDDQETVDDSEESVKRANELIEKAKSSDGTSTPDMEQYAEEPAEV